MAAHVWTDPGSDLPGAEVAHGGDGVRYDASDHAGPPGVGCPDHAGRGVGEQDGHAVGGPHQQGQLGLVSDECVGNELGAVVRRVDGDHLTAVHLPQPDHWSGQAELLGNRPQAGLRWGHLGRRGSREGEVERLTGPPVPVGEGHLDPATPVMEREHATIVAELLGPPSAGCLLFR